MAYPTLLGCHMQYDENLYTVVFLWRCILFPARYTPVMERIKTYKALLLSVLGLVIVVGGAYWYMKDKPAPKEAVVKSSTRTIEGEVVRQFEGENKIVYNLDIPEQASTTLGMDGALVKVLTGATPYVSMYFSYEGGRGYMPTDYIKNVIAPHVNSVAIVGTTTIGSYTWTVAQSAASEWHVAQVGNGSWLLIVENKRALHDQVADTLDSLTTK